MDVIETADVELAAYAMARGGALQLIEGAEGVAFRLEGAGMEEAEADFAHFGSHGIAPERMRRLMAFVRSMEQRCLLLATVYLGRRA